MLIVGHIQAAGKAAVALLVAVLLTAVIAIVATTAGAAQSTVGLGTADSFAVLAGTGVTNTGPTVISGDLGTCPTPAVTGFPPGIVNGTTHANDGVACGAQADLTIAYDDAAGRAPDTTFGGATDLGSPTPLAPGVYKTPRSFAITGTLTLDGQADPNSVFIFQAGSTLITSVASNVVLINGAQACNVFWQVGSSATLGVDSTLAGTVLALTSIAANTNAVIQGRLLARNGSTTLDSNTITATPCAAPTTTTAAPTTTTAVGPTTTAAGPTTTVAGPTTTAVATTATTAATATTLPPTATGAPTTTTVAATAATPTTTGSPATTTTMRPTAAANTEQGDAPTRAALSTATGPGIASLTTTPSAAAVSVVSDRTTSGATAGIKETARGFARTGAPLRWTSLAAGVLLVLGGLLVALAQRKPSEAR